MKNERLERLEDFLHHNGKRMNLPDEIPGTVMMAIADFADSECAALASQLAATRKDVKYLAEMLGVGYDAELGQYDDGSLNANIGMLPEPMYDDLQDQFKGVESQLEKAKAALNNAARLSNQESVCTICDTALAEIAESDL